jgi:hypothetical protein
MKRITLLLFLILLSCSGSKVRDKAVYYYFESDMEPGGKPADSILFYPYNNLKSLALHTPKDSLHFFIADWCYYGIFTVNHNKFAAIADTTSTIIYQYVKPGWKEMHIISGTELGRDVIIMQKDINNDGFKDAVIRYISGGFYGEDNICLLYDPEIKNFDYPNAVKLHNITFGGPSEIISNWKFKKEHFLIHNFMFVKTTEEELLQGDMDDKKIVKKFSLQGLEISRDTVTSETQE